MGLIAHLGRTETLRRETERLQPHLGETEIPIGETDLPRVCGSGYDIQTRWRRIEKSVELSLTLGLGHMCGSGKVVEGIWSISLSTLSKQAIKQHLIPP